MTKEQQIPAAVLRRDDEGGPLPQMVAQHREQLRQEREATPSSKTSLDRCLKFLRGFGGAHEDWVVEIEALQRNLALRNEQIDGYERQLGIDQAGAERTIGSELERLRNVTDVLKTVYRLAAGHATECQCRQCEIFELLEPIVGNTSPRSAHETNGSQLQGSFNISPDERDAIRYRFLRQPGNAIVYAKDRDAWGKNNSGHVRYDTAEQLDAAVDAAISKGSHVEPEPRHTGIVHAGGPHTIHEGSRDDCAICSSLKPTRPLPDSAKAPAKAGDPCPAVEDVHTEHAGKCMYCGAPMAPEKASAPLDREAVNALALQCAQASAVVRNREWNFDRYRNGKLKAQGVTVHAATEAEAWEKARSLLHIDGNMPTDELRLQPLNGKEGQS